MEKELVSILIPVFNRVTLIEETINSALSQTYKNTEIIIVDNCSTDGTWEVIQKYAKTDIRIRVYQNKSNIGPVRNWEKCIQLATGKYSKILFSDDLMSENFIEECISQFDNSTAFILSDIQVFSDEKEFNLAPYKNKLIYKTKKYFKDLLIFNYNKFPVSPGAALFRTSDLKNSILIDIPNPHNTDFSIYGAGNDLLIFLLTAIKYNKIRISNNATAYFRYHDDSFTIANDLFFYYEFAKYYFISNFKTELLSLYKFSLRWNFRKSEKNHFHEIFNVKIKLKDKIFFFKKKLLYKMKTKYISYEWRK